MKRREPAVVVMIDDLAKGTKEEVPTEEGASRTYLITPTGARIFRAIISGVLMEKEDIGSEQGPLFRLRLADPSGGISFTVGRFNTDLLGDVANLKVPSFVTVCGKVSTFTSRKGEEVVTLNPEAIVECTREERDLWHLTALRDSLSRLWKMEGGNPTSQRHIEVPVPEMPRGGEDMAEQARTMVQKCLISLDRSRFLKMLEEARSGKKAQPPEESSDLEQYEDRVIEMISSLDKGDGARWDDVVDYIERKRLSRDVIEEVVSNLLDKGLLYEPVLGYLKAV